jgi:hypothetical protein
MLFYLQIVGILSKGEEIIKNKDRVYSVGGFLIYPLPESGKA